MTQNTPTILTIEAAIARARHLIHSGETLTRAASAVSRAHPMEREAATQVKDSRLLDYRVVTTPDVLIPALETLIQAASANTSGRRVPEATGRTTAATGAPRD